jgi:hypothetical protein
MANTKISALPAATTPLAGTEVLPIVQSGSTVKVAASNIFQLTTTGTSGAATWTGGTLNVPQYGAGTGTVTTISVVSANGLAGTVANATTTPAITLSTSISGVLKGDGTSISAAQSNVDYLTPPNGTSIQKANNFGALQNAVAGTDYQAPITLTTTGTSGAATFVSNTLNIPQYSAGGGGVTKAQAIAYSMFW